MNDGRPTGSPAYRGDLQGMRALAVLAVIAAHAQVRGLQGGFVGVDVFFVISGCLITQLILGTVERTDRFSLREFYARRARRILPAATLVLLVTTGASLIYLNFLDALDLTRDAVWAAFFGANIHFATQGVDYFALEDAPSPIQHYWSLSVEEQFYVVWPILVALVILIVRRAGRRRRERQDRATSGTPVRTLFVVATLLGGLSLAWSIHVTRIEPTGAYFSTLTRAWELAAGCLVALALHGGRAVRQRAVSEVLGWGGLAAIVVAVLRYNDTMAFPGYEALLPVLGTVAVLAAGSYVERPPWSARLLAVPPLRRLGDWSYSLYLWHWPLIVIPEINLGRDLSPTETLIAVAITLELGYLTYRFVEQPFRTRRLWRASYRGLLLYPLSLVLVLPAVAGGHAYLMYVGTHRGDHPPITASDYGLPKASVTALVQASVDAARDHKPIPSNLDPSLLSLHDDVADVGACNYMYSTHELCRRGDTSSDKVIVVTGDSHARAWIPAFDKIAEQAGYATYYLVKQQCTAAWVDPGQLGTGARWPECQEFHQWVQQQIEQIHPALLVVATSPPPTGVYVDGRYVKTRTGVEQAMAGGFDAMFAAYQPYADQTKLIVDVPRLPVEPSECLASTHATMYNCTFSPTTESDQYQQISIDAARRAHVPTIDPTAWFCADDECPMVVGSTIAYRDRAHISATRAAELWRPLGQALGLLPDPNGPDPAVVSPVGRHRHGPLAPEGDAPSDEPTDPPSDPAAQGSDTGDGTTIPTR